MNTKILNIAVLFFIFLSSCQTAKNGEEGNSKDEKVQSVENEEKYENQIAAIENNTELLLINSLAYNNNAGSRIEVVAYLDKGENEVKIEESFTDVKSGNYGKFTYYIDKGKKFATKQVYFENQLKEPSFVERISFYDKDERVIFSKERVAPFEDELEKAAFEISIPKDCSIERAMRVLNQEGEFTTTFQGFASDGNLSYLLVGENTSDGYASSLAVQYKEGDITKLMNNEKAMIGKPLEVVHQVMVDERGLKFQVLLSVKIK